MPASSCQSPCSSPQALPQPLQPSPPPALQPDESIRKRGSHSPSKGTQTTQQWNYSPNVNCFRLPLQGKRGHICLQPSLVFRVIPCTLLSLQSRSDFFYSLSRLVFISLWFHIACGVPYQMVMSNETSSLTAPPAPAWRCRWVQDCYWVGRWMI